MCVCVCVCVCVYEFKSLARLGISYSANALGFGKLGKVTGLDEEKLKIWNLKFDLKSHLARMENR